MGKNKGLFSKLKKSTIITMVSCGSFVVMTFLALLFFIKFPITPSEKIISSIGRESIYRHNSAESLAVTATAVTDTQTTTATSLQTTTAVQTTTVSATHSDFVITITTGKGFFTGGRIPTIEYNPDELTDDYMDIPEDTATTTVTDEYAYDYDYDYDDTIYTEPDYNNYNYDYNYDNNYDWNY